MKNIFQQDEWTKCFCLIFNKLVDKRKVQIKRAFAQEVGITHASTFNHILAGERDFPIQHRQHAMQVLRDNYHVNMQYFLNRNNPMFVVEDDDELPLNPRRPGALSFAEMLDCQKCKQENEILKKMLEDKERLITAQAALIEALQGK